MSADSFVVGGLSIAKRGSGELGCEDAFSYSTAPHNSGGAGAPIALAVSDGASESLLAKDWAHLVVRRLGYEAFTDPNVLQHHSERYAIAVRALKFEWEHQVLPDYLRRRQASARPVQWYEQPKLEAGASATVLMFRLEHAADSGERTWRALAVGDTCLFQVRAGRVIRCFPIEDVAAFGRTPDLLRSRGPETMQERLRLARGTYAVGDGFFAMTDAVAKWFMHTANEGAIGAFAETVEALRGLCCAQNELGLRTWMHAIQAAGQMQSDDVTCAYVGVIE